MITTSQKQNFNGTTNSISSICNKNESILNGNTLNNTLPKLISSNSSINVNRHCSNSISSQKHALKMDIDLPLLPPPPPIIPKIQPISELTEIKKPTSDIKIPVRLKSTTSCIRCYVSKVKCSDMRPCERCVRLEFKCEVRPCSQCRQNMLLCDPALICFHCKKIGNKCIRRSSPDSLLNRTSTNTFLKNSDSNISCTENYKNQHQNYDNSNLSDINTSTNNTENFDEKSKINACAQIMQVLKNSTSSSLKTNQTFDTLTSTSSNSSSNNSSFDSENLTSEDETSLNSLKLRQKFYFSRSNLCQGISLSPSNIKKCKRLIQTFLKSNFSVRKKIGNFKKPRLRKHKFYKLKSKSKHKSMKIKKFEKPIKLFRNMKKGERNLRSLKHSRRKIPVPIPVDVKPISKHRIEENIMINVCFKIHNNEKVRSKCALSSLADIAAQVFESVSPPPPPPLPSVKLSALRLNARFNRSSFDSIIDRLRSSNTSLKNLVEKDDCANKQVSTVSVHERISLASCVRCWAWKCKCSTKRPCLPCQRANVVCQVRPCYPCQLFKTVDMCDSLKPCKPCQERDSKCSNRQTQPDKSKIPIYSKNISSNSNFDKLNLGLDLKLPPPPLQTFNF